MSIDIIKGDFMYPAWEEGSHDKMKKKIRELKSKGYRKIKTEHDFQNVYRYFRNGDRDEVILTELCL